MEPEWVTIFIFLTFDNESLSSLAYFKTYLNARFCIYPKDSVLSTSPQIPFLNSKTTLTW